MGYYTTSPVISLLLTFFNVKKSFPAFPHQSTADQFFDEPQFESYRALGSFIMDALSGTGFEDLELPCVVGRAFASLYAVCQQNGKELDAEFVEWLSALTGFRIVGGKVVPPEAARDASGGQRETGDEGAAEG